MVGRSLLVLACLLAGNAAVGEEAGNGTLATHLIYERAPGAEACPDERALRAEVARRVGRDPFDAAAPRIIVCRVDRLGRGLRARIEVGANAPGEPPTRELVSKRTDCQNLAEAVAVALSIAITPVIASPPAPDGDAPATPSPSPPPAAMAVPLVPSPAPPPAPVEAPALVAAPAGPASTSPAAAKATRERGVAFRFAIDGVLAAGLVPGLGYAGDVAAGVASRRYSAEVDLRVVAPSSRAAGRGSLALWQWAVLVAPCAHRGYLAACLLGSAGMLYGSGDGLVITERTQSPHVAAGARAVAEVPLTGERLRMRASFDLTAALTQTHFTVAGSEAWASPRVAAGLGIGVVGVFF